MYQNQMIPLFFYSSSICDLTPAFYEQGIPYRHQIGHQLGKDSDHNHFHSDLHMSIQIKNLEDANKNLEDANKRIAKETLDKKKPTKMMTVITIVVII